MRKALSCRGRRLDDPLTRQRHRKSIYSSVSCKTLSACGLPPVPPTAAAVRRVAAPYKLRVNKFVQILRADNIRFYSALIHYSLLLITLSVSKTSLSVSAYAEPAPLQGSQNRLCDRAQILNLNCTLQYIQKAPTVITAGAKTAL